MLFFRSNPARVVALAMTIVAIALGLLLFGKPLPAQGTGAPLAAYLLIRGADTVVVERVSLARDTLTGVIALRGGPRVEYVAAIVNGPAGPAIPFLTFRAFGPGTAPDAAPTQVGTLRITADSAILEAGSGTGPMQRVPVANPGSPLPLLNGSIALANPFISRARASSDRPYKGRGHFIQGPGLPIDVSIDLSLADTALFTLNGQVYRFALDPFGFIVGGSIPAQGLTIVRISGAAAGRASLGRTEYGAPTGAPYTSEEVAVQTRAGHLLSGTLTLPKNATGPVPAVVTITGSGQQDRDESMPTVAGFRPFRQVADTLGRRGIAVLRLDDRGINGSGGDVPSATSADFADDIRAGIAYLRTRKEIDADRVALFGHSEGGMIGPMIAATDPRLAGLVIAAGPAYNGRRIIDFQLRNLVMGNPRIRANQKDSATRVAIAAWDSSAAKSPWMQFFLSHDPIATLKKVKTPTLVLQGGTDQQVTPEQAPLIEKALRDGGNQNVTMRVFANRNHLFLADSIGFPGGYTALKDTRIGSDVLGPLADWLAVTLKATTLKP